MPFSKIHTKLTLDNFWLLSISFTIIGLLLTGTHVYAELYEGQITFPRGAPVYYLIEDGQLLDMELNAEENSITSKIDMNDNYGSLTISIPRNVIDSRFSTHDMQFLVFVNNTDIDFKEVDTEYEEFRTLLIPLNPQDKTITIAGMNTGTNSEIIESSQNNVVTIPLDSSLIGCKYTNSCFEPNIMDVNTGETVTWQNQDLLAHTITSGNATNGLDGFFDSGLIFSGGSFEYMFSASGIYGYFCMIHPWMEGSIIVEDISNTVNSEIPTKDTNQDFKLPSQITFEFTESTTIGQIVLFSGQLTSNGNLIPNAQIQIRDEDMLDADDLLASGITDSDGRYSISWMVKDTETNDKKTGAKLLEFSTQTYGISVLNSILNIMDANTVEVFAEFKGSSTHEKSNSCNKDTQYKSAHSLCNNNILVITNIGNALENKIAESLLKKMVQDKTVNTSEMLFLILYDNDISNAMVDDFRDVVLEEFFLYVTSDSMSDWIDNIRTWYNNGDISEKDVFYLIQFFLDKKII